MEGVQDRRGIRGLEVPGRDGVKAHIDRMQNKLPIIRKQILTETAQTSISPM